MNITFKAINESFFTHSIDEKTKVKRCFLEVPLKEFVKLSVLKDWIEINPRCQNLQSKPAKAMADTLDSDLNNIFHILNKGITLSAERCYISQNNKEYTVSMDLKTKHSHGILDGAHTFFVIQEAIENGLTEGSVIIEVFVGIEKYIYEIAKARNTSVQVKDKSIANLEGKFDFIKQALISEAYFPEIAWKENEGGNIDIIKLLQIIVTMNPEFGFRAYRNSGKAEKVFIDNYNKNMDNGQKDNSFYRLTPLMPDFLLLFDIIQTSFPNAYGKGFGQIKCFKHKKEGYHLDFLGEEMDHQIPAGLILMIMSALKTLIILDPTTHLYQWETSPFVVYEKASKKLVKSLVKEFVESGGNIADFTRHSIHWQLTELAIKEASFDYKQSVIKKELLKKESEKKHA